MTDYSELKRLAKEAETCGFSAPEAYDDDRHYTVNELNYLEYLRLTQPTNVLALIAENEALREEIAIDNKIIADRERLLNMFDCPDHGRCTPYAMEQVEALRKAANELRNWATCEQVHHNKCEQHEYDEPCKVLARIDKVLSKEPKG